MRPFDGCRQRLRRANFHRDALSDVWREFATKDSIWMSQVEDGGLFYTFALQFGEMLYQIRAALDGIVYQAAILETGQNPPLDEHNFEFPICGTAAEFVKKAPLYLRPLAQKRRDIIESVQPYKIPDLAPEDVVLNFNRALGILNDCEIPPPCADNDTLVNRGLAMLRAARWLIDTIEESF